MWKVSPRGRPVPPLLVSAARAALLVSVDPAAGAGLPAGADLPARAGRRVGAIVEPAEEQRRAGQVLEGLGPVVQLGLKVLLGERVAAQSLE